MEKCCHNPYYDCERFLGCFIDLAVRVPDSYPDESITLRFSKWIGKVLSARVTLNISAGWAIIDSESLPEGFLNPYGGAYTLEFLDSNGIVFPFVAKDGKTYLKASFDIMPSTDNAEIGLLNFIDNQILP
jgi:hypothetical protein